MRRNLTVNDLSTDPEIVKALEAYDQRVKEADAQMSAYDSYHRGWDELIIGATPVADGAHAVADLGPDLSNDLSEHDSNGEA